MAVKLECHIARARHLCGVAHKAESGDVCAAVHLYALHRLPRVLVEEGHGGFDLGILLVSQKVCLRGRCEYACSDLLGDDQKVSGVGAVAQYGIRMREARDGKPVLRLFVVYAVAADYSCAGLGYLVVSALEYALYRVERQLSVRESQKVHGELRLAAHRVYVAQSVGCCDLPEHVRVVYDRREEIHCIDHCYVVGQLVDAGVVAAFESDEYVRVAYLRQTR